MSAEQGRLTPKERRQQESDAICRQLRTDCEDLLVSPFAKKKKMGSITMVWNVFVDVVAAGSAGLAPLGDTTYVDADVKDENGTLMRYIRAAATTLRKDIRKVGEIELYSSESDYYVTLGKSVYRRILRPDRGQDAFGLSGPKWSRRSAVPLNDAHYWQEVVEDLKEVNQSS